MEEKTRAKPQRRKGIGILGCREGSRRIIRYREYGNAKTPSHEIPLPEKPDLKKLCVFAPLRENPLHRKNIGSRKAAETQRKEWLSRKTLNRRHRHLSILPDTFSLKNLCVFAPLRENPLHLKKIGSRKAAETQREDGNEDWHGGW